MLFDQILDRGFLKIGVTPDQLGFSVLENETWIGFDIDLGKALAAAIFGDPTKVEFVSQPFSDSFVNTANGSVDLTATSATHNLFRDAAFNIDFSPVLFYDAQDILVRADSNINNPLDLQGKRIGTLAGSSSTENIEDFLVGLDVDFVSKIYPSIAKMAEAYEGGEIDAISIDRSILWSLIPTLSAPENQKLLDTDISKEPLALVVPEDDSQWADIVKWINYVPVQAEEYGINSANIDQIIAETTDPEIRTFLGLEGTLGEALGLPNDFAVQVIKAVGNYSEIHERNFGQLPREKNNLETNDGLLYSLPFAGSIPGEVNLVDNDDRDLLQEILDRDTLKLGITGNNPGFAVQQDDSTFVGFDIDLGRAIAAAVLGDANKLEVIVQTFNNGFNNVANGVVDVTAMGVTDNLVRDASLGIDFSPTYIYTGQGILVRADSGIKFLPDLNGRTIGVSSGTTSLANLEDALAEIGATFTPKVYPTNDELFAAYDRGEVDAVSTDLTILSGRIPTLAEPENQLLLNDIISKEPLALVIDENQSEWGDIVRWVVNALVEAEELGINSSNIEELLTINTDDNPDNNSTAEIRRFLGLEGNLGETLGLSNDFAVKAIEAVGNYAEIYENHFDSSLLPRGDNQLFTNFGLQYSPPFSGSPVTSQGNQVLFVAPDNQTAFRVSSSDSSQIVFSGSGEDEINAADANPNLPDRLYTGSANDLLIAGYQDRLFGGTGDDTLDASSGGGGNRLYGGEGNDTLYAGIGNNILSGGTGEDRFVIAKDELPEQSNTILDFEPGTDIIEISGLTLNSQPISFADLIIVDSTAGVEVRIEELSGTYLAIFLGLTAENLNISSNFEF
jgi:ABC-type amino acid transport substrate-binding protein